MPTELTYTEAFTELKEIVSEMENSEIGIDLLEDRVKRASILLKICKEKLTKTEKNVMETLESLNTEE